MTAQPPSSTRAILLLIRIGARRWFNRLSTTMGAAFRGRGKKKGRTGTARKGSANSFMLLFLGVVFMFGAASMSSRMLASIGSKLVEKEAEQLGIVRLRGWFIYTSLEQADKRRAEAITEANRTDTGEGEARSIPLEDIRYEGSIYTSSGSESPPG